MRHAPAPVFSRTGHRSENEDAVWLHSTTRLSGQSVSMLAVADGMGGHTHGAKASEIAIRVLEDAADDWLTTPDALDEDRLRIESRQLFERVDQAIEMYTGEHPDAKGMGTTLVVAVVVEDQAYVAHIGDSRAYWVSQDGTVSQLTQDHSAAAEAIREGRMTEEEVAQSPFKHALTRSLDGSGDSAPDFGVRSIREPGFLLLCSDGLSGSIDDEQFAEELLRSAPLADSTEALIDAALDQGSEDNISLVTLECGVVERTEDRAGLVADPSPEASAEEASTEQGPAGSNTSSSSAQYGAAPSERPPPTSRGAPQWAVGLLGGLVLVTLGLGGWAEYRYGLVGVFPQGGASGNGSITADAPGEAPPALPDSARENRSFAGARSGSRPNGKQSDSSQTNAATSAAMDARTRAHGEGRSSSQESEESEPPADIAGQGPAADEEVSEGQSEIGAPSPASEPSKTAEESPSDQPGSAGGDGAGSRGPISLDTQQVRKVPEGEVLDQKIPHERFDSRVFRIQRVNGTTDVGSKIELESGALLRVEPKGRFQYDPNGTFQVKDKGQKATDQFTYTAVTDTAVSESGGRKLQGTVKIPIVGKNTPPTLKTNEELRLEAGQARPIRRRNLEATDPDDEPAEISLVVTGGATQGQILVGDGSASAKMDSSFTQRDVNEGRVFYEDTTGEAGRDTVHIAAEDDNGARAKEKAVRVLLTEPRESGVSESVSAGSNATKTETDTENDCRVQFAAWESKPDESPLRQRLNSVKLGTGDELSVSILPPSETSETKHILVSDSSGSRKEIKIFKNSILNIKGVKDEYDGVENTPIVKCFSTKSK